jgi:hypothetical protein
MSVIADCQVQDTYGHCAKTAVGDVVSWLVLAAVIALVVSVAVVWWRNRRYASTRPEGSLDAEQIADDGTEPRAATRLEAVTTTDRMGPVEGQLRAGLAAFTLTNQPTGQTASRLLAPRCAVEIRDRQTGRVVTTFDWSHDPNGAERHVRSLNNRAQQLGLTAFCLDVGLPPLIDGS